MRASEAWAVALGASLLGAPTVSSSVPERASASADTPTSTTPGAPAPTSTSTASSGRIIQAFAAPSPDGFKLHACSFREPLCVYAPPSVASATVIATVAAAERAWELATGALGFPAPDVDLMSGTYPLYFLDRAPMLAETLLSARDVHGGFDRASAFTLLDARLTAGCTLDALVAREIARAIAWRVVPATDRGTVGAQTAYLARLMVPCAMGTVDGVDAFQAHPERAIADAQIGDEFTRGAGLFYWWLDYSFGSSPGVIVRALWSLSPTLTPVGALRWNNEPDAYDVLRTTFKNALMSESTIDDLWLDFAVARAFMGDADDGEKLPESRSLGAAARVRRDWEVGWPDRPRTLASATGVAPTGAAYIAVDLHGAPPGARLRIEASWEEHAKMRWAVVKLDDAGHEKARIAIAAAERSTEAQMSVVDLEGVARILIVGTNTGDPLYPMDPDDEIWEPHGWMLTLASEAP
jgi:hypothetical protein